MTADENKDIVPSRSVSRVRPKESGNKKASEFMAALREESTTNPNTDPNEALRRISKVMSTILKSEDPLVTQAYREILRRNGHNPDEWQRYPNVPQPKNFDVGFTDTDMAFLSRYPKSLEFFVTQGEPFGYYEKYGQVVGQKFGIMDHFWIAFVRRRPTDGAEVLLEQKSS